MRPRCNAALVAVPDPGGGAGSVGGHIIIGGECQDPIGSFEADAEVSPPRPRPCKILHRPNRFIIPAQLALLDPSSQAGWERIAVAVDAQHAPGPRRGHTAVTIDGKIFVFGGQRGSSVAGWCVGAQFGLGCPALPIAPTNYTIPRRLMPHIFTAATFTHPCRLVCCACCVVSPWQRCVCAH